MGRRGHLLREIFSLFLIVCISCYLKSKLSKISIYRWLIAVSSFTFIFASLIKMIVPWKDVVIIAKTVSILSNHANLSWSRLKQVCLSIHICSVSIHLYMFCVYPPVYVLCLSTHVCSLSIHPYMLCVYPTVYVLCLSARICSVLVSSSEKCFLSLNTKFPFI